MDLITGLTMLDLSRFQFAMTTIFHFFFVPLSIGLGIMVAIMEPCTSSKVTMYTTYDEVLGKNFPFELCRWSCYWNYSRVPIRNELVTLLTLCW
ncbi:Cytochrome d ubiquinol oxidase subunit 1 [Weissella viridescens]|uniref:Cytochrome d ubiquinol oxidase subunit 1 n=1 Tax=Weissella viridescens TaxID=1629 RepID=A0A380P7X6_WEIVI|nr:Cytochrome d ubiquinol oxidase subunit 1 [Weissella viridescens]